MKSSLLAQFASAGDSESGDSGCSSTSAKKLIPNSSTKRYRGLLAYGFAKFHPMVQVSVVCTGESSVDGVGQHLHVSQSTSIGVVQL
ncbi:uncharacterized protein LOC121995607 isoform X2 [Zingiber officinale]|uniref:uncharacterized protein LOC121995607 isoform X2 n=1 Tax=Zingiber officinale TaxID=94328 RepID=UPI001C4C0593|nr:uncharacterized protein LOC121995607 isoform X2 [Zingiber officinale]